MAMHSGKVELSCLYQCQVQIKISSKISGKDIAAHLKILSIAVNAANKWILKYPTPVAID